MADPFAPVDYSPKGIAPGEGGAGVPNAFGMLGSYADIQNKLNANRQFQQSFAAKQKAGQIIASAPDMDTAIKNMSADPLVSGFAPDVIQSARATDLLNTQIGGERQKQGMEGLKQILQNAPAYATNPAGFDSMTQAWMATLSPGAQKSVSTALPSLKESILGGLPADPQQAQATVGQRLLALGVASGSIGGTDAAAAVIGKRNDVINTGGGQQFIQRDLLGGQVSRQGSMGNTLTPQVTSVPQPDGSTKTMVVGGGGLGGGEMRGGNTGGGTPPVTGVGSGGGGTLGTGRNGRGTAVPPANPLMPAPPPSSGGNVLGVGPGTVSQTVMQKTGEAGAAYKDSLDQRTSALSGVLQRIVPIREAMQQVNLGGGAEAYGKLATALQAVGASDSIVQSVSNGSLPATQEINKLLGDSVMNQFKAQLPDHNRGGTEKEFQQFVASNPNLDLDPRATDKIFNFWTQQYNLAHQEQGEFNAALNAPGGKDKIANWQSHWQDRLLQMGKVNPDENVTTPTKAEKDAGKVPARVPPPGAVTHKYVPGQGIVPVGQ